MYVSVFTYMISHFLKKIFFRFIITEKISEMKDRVLTEPLCLLLFLGITSNRLFLFLRERFNVKLQFIFNEVLECMSLL